MSLSSSRAVVHVRSGYAVIYRATRVHQTCAVKYIQTLRPKIATLALEYRTGTDCTLGIGGADYFAYERVQHSKARIANCDSRMKCEARAPVAFPSDDQNRADP